MHIHNQRRQRITLVLEWLRKERVDLPAIAAFIANPLCMRQLEGVLEDWIEFRETFPVTAREHISLMGDLTEPDIGRMLIGTGKNKTLQVWRGREMRPESITNISILHERANGPICLVHYPDLVPHSFPGNKEQPLTVRIPATPARTTSDTRCQIAGFAIRE